jgi:hypothetical protein
MWQHFSVEVTAMALFELTGQEVRSAPPIEGPPLWGPHGVRSLEFELSDAGVSISEARQVGGASGYEVEALEALGGLAGALEKGDMAWTETALSRVERQWQSMGQRPAGGGLDAVVWRAVCRVLAACRGWLYKVASEGSKAKSRSIHREAGRLRQACGF